MSTPIPKPVKTTLQKSDILKKLERDGYEEIGHGAFGTVYAKPGDNTHVVKIGGSSDEYMHYVKHVGLNNPNPHVPHIREVKQMFRDETYKDWFGKKRKSRYHFYTVVMERLIRWEEVPPAAQRKALKRVGITAVEDLIHANKMKPTNEPARSFKKLLVAALRSKRNSIDISTNNVMFRKRKPGVFDLVVTDPLC